ncbi:MAG: AAA family ATPase [Candidatus Sericytochromatia bacterium]|nr:AAA family ATPase [Candidatus Sericytochromatia bacterium]
MNVEEITYSVKQESQFIISLRDEMSKVIVGQSQMVDSLLMSIFSNGHILLEGVPGLAKTTAVKALSEILNLDFKRIQFTPDLLPADLIGTQVYIPREGTFTTRKGPIFSNIVLADEINRAPSKVQSALLEAMQEHQVTIGGETYHLPEPFLVLATQNPIDQEGTYTLPEAQSDRFMFKIKVSYPTKEEEKEIVKKMSITETVKLRKLVDTSDIMRIRSLIEKIYIDDKLQDYIINLIFATREPQKYNLTFENIIQYGASPRASIFLTKASKARAFLNGRGYVTPQDIRAVGMDILRHRILLSYEAEAENLTTEDIINRIFDKIEIP